MRYDEKKLTAGQKPSAQQSYVQQAGGAAGAAFQRARANQGLPSGQQSYVQQAGAAAGNAFQQAWAREMGNRQQPAATGALQLNVGEMRNALQNGMPGNWRAANGQNSPAQAGYVSQNADTMAGLRQQMGELADRYANRGPFQVNLANDALYKQLAQQYAQMGQRAMKDTMGQAAGLTGGYGSSYGQNVGQQAYSQQMQGLNDAALSIYDRAKARWDDEGDRMLRQIDLLGSQYDRERAADADAYGRYRDQVGDERYADELAYSRGRDQIADERYIEERDYDRDWRNREWEYNVGRDRIADQRYIEERDYDRDWRNREWEYNVGRDRIADQRYEDERDYNRIRDRINDERYADELAYSRNRDRIADERYADERDYNRNRDSIADQRYADEWDYNTGRDTRDDGWQQAMTWLQAGIVPDASVLQAAGISAADAQRLANYYSFAHAGSYGGSSSGSGRRSRRSSGTTPGVTPSTTPTAEQVAAAAAPGLINAALTGVETAVNSNRLTQDVLESWAKRLARAKGDESVLAAFQKEFGTGKAAQQAWEWIGKHYYDYIPGYANAYPGLD